MSRYIDMGWIKCRDRLPTNDGMYLVTVLTEDSLIVDIATYETKTDTWTRGFPMGYSIAWMPLPEPYNEVTE